MHQGTKDKRRRHRIESGRKCYGIDPQQDRNQQNLPDVSDAVAGHRLAVAKIGQQESPRCLLRLPAQVAETCRQQDLLLLQHRRSNRHEHEQDQAERHGEHHRVAKQARSFLIGHDTQSDRQRIGDERVVDRPQEEDGAEKEGKFSVVLLAERAGEQHIEQKVTSAHSALIDKRP